MLNLRPAGAVPCPGLRPKGRRGRLTASYQPPGDWHPLIRNSENDHHPIDHRPGNPFPGPLTLGPDGILTAPPRERLVEIAAAVDANHLLVFADRLIRGVRRRRFKASRAELNRAYLELARLCIDRTLTSGGRTVQ